MNARDSHTAERLARDFGTDRLDLRELTPLKVGGSGFIFRMILKDGAVRALKIFRPDQIDQPTLLQGFEEEGKRLCGIRHPRIVQGYEAGIRRFPSVDMDLPYYVMEFIPHESLEAVLERNQLPPKYFVVLNLLRQTLEALQYIHSLNPPLVHLDVKEANLLVDMTSPESPAIKLSDFGVSKVVSREERSTEVRGTLFYWPKAWQAKLKERLPSNINRATIRLPRNEIPPEVDLHMLSVTYQQVLDRVFVGQEESYWHRGLSLILERMNWDHHRRSRTAEKYRNAGMVLVDLHTLERVPSLPPPLEEKGSLRIPVHSLHSYGEAACALLDCPWFQRLRRVRQLGLAHYVYPGAVHSRFEHTIGAYSHVLLYLKALFENRNSPWFAMNFSPRETKALAFTALVHDLGHYPFAHLLEDVENWPRHEVLSYEIMTGLILKRFPALERVFGDPGVILQTAKQHWGLSSDLVVRMFCYCYRAELPGIPAPREVPRGWRAATQILNGPIDSDKLDYIRRDSHHCGVSYGMLSDIATKLISHVYQ
jgi:tRNA A-37 threonylcarbamoyl transferase component Bud32